MPVSTSTVLLNLKTFIFLQDKLKTKQWPVIEQFLVVTHKTRLQSRGCSSEAKSIKPHSLIEKRTIAHQ